MEKRCEKTYEGRYDRNIGTVTPEEQRLLKKKSVCVAGCGGLGGGIIENLTRLGIGRLTIVDGDAFEASNLNRQVLSHQENLGVSKAEEGARQMKRINADVEVRPLQMQLDGSNSREVIYGHDVVVDALDNVRTRLVLEDACEAESIPLVHGAIAGWNGQAAVILPGQGLLHRLYQDCCDCGMEKETGNPAFTPAVIAGIQTGEVLKLLLGREGVLANRLLLADLLCHQYEIIDFEE